jgi:hypothetical protein
VNCPTGRCRDYAPCSVCLDASLGAPAAQRYESGRKLLELIQDAADAEFPKWLSGRRLPDGHPELAAIQAGDYWKNPNDRIVDGPCWYVCDPGGNHYALRKYDVIEHDDGTISVPDVLDHGVWIEG